MNAEAARARSTLAIFCLLFARNATKYSIPLPDPFACTCHLIAAANQAKAAAATAAAAAAAARGGSSTGPSAPSAPSTTGRQRHASGQPGPGAVPPPMGHLLHWTSSESTLVPTEVVRQQQRMIHYHHHLRAAADQVSDMTRTTFPNHCMLRLKYSLLYRVENNGLYVVWRTLLLLLLTCCALPCLGPA